MPASPSAIAALTTGAASTSGNYTALSPTNSNILTTTLQQDTNESTFTTGLNGVWRPGGYGYGLGGLAIMAGYEYNNINRQLADYNTSNLVAPVLTQYNTVTNSFQVGPDMRWSQYFDTYLHYKFQAAQSPLVGVQGYNSVANSLLPTTDNMVEIGGTWMPNEHFMLNATFGVEYAVNQESVGITNPTASVTSAYSNNNISFDEEDYPFSINFFYGVTGNFSITGGYSEMSNFIAQNIFAADQTSGGTPTLGGRWSYGGRADVFNLGAEYRADGEAALHRPGRLCPRTRPDQQLQLHQRDAGHFDRRHRRLLRSAQPHHQGEPGGRLPAPPADDHLHPLRVVRLLRAATGAAGDGYYRSFPTRPAPARASWVVSRPCSNASPLQREAKSARRRPSPDGRRRRLGSSW